LYCVVLWYYGLCFVFVLKTQFRSCARGAYVVAFFITTASITPMLLFSQCMLGFLHEEPPLTQVNANPTPLTVCLLIIHTVFPGALSCYQCNVFIRGTPWPCNAEKGMRKVDDCHACLKTYTRSYLHNTFHDRICKSIEWLLRLIRSK